LKWGITEKNLLFYSLYQLLPASSLNCS